MIEMWILVGLLIICLIYNKIRSERIINKLTSIYEEKIEQLEKQKIKALDTQRAVIRGAISEELAPLLPNFPYNGSDCKFLGQPFDYLVLDGMSKFRDTGEGEIKLVLLEIKTGNSRLTKVEKAIKEAVEKGNIEFKTIKL